MKTMLQNTVRSTGSLLSLRRSKRRRWSSTLMSMILGGFLYVGSEGEIVSRAEIIDRLVAVVNRQIITLGDVEQEERLQGLDAFSGSLGGKSPTEQRITQDVVVQRLIEQILIREQIQQFPGLEIDETQVESQLASVQKKLAGDEKLAGMK